MINETILSTLLECPRHDSNALRLWYNGSELEVYFIQVQENGTLRHVGQDVIDLKKQPELEGIVRNGWAGAVWDAHLLSDVVLMFTEAPTLTALGVEAAHDTEEYEIPDAWNLSEGGVYLRPLSVEAQTE